MLEALVTPIDLGQPLKLPRAGSCSSVAVGLCSIFQQLGHLELWKLTKQLTIVPSRVARPQSFRCALCVSIRRAMGGVHVVVLSTATATPRGVFFTLSPVARLSHDEPRREGDDANEQAQRGLLTHHIPNCILNYVFLLFDGITLVGVHFQRCPKVLSEVCESVRLPSPLFDELVVLPPCKLLARRSEAWFLATIQKLAKETHEMHDL